MSQSSDFEEETSFKSNFHACYMLVSTNIRFKDRVYIGYCVDPIRRIKQHNSGAIYGGASKTNYRGPWKMVALVFPFPNQIYALKFEWAWQNPTKSKILKLRSKKSKESNVKYTLYVLYMLLNDEVTRRLALKIRFESDEILELFNEHVQNMHIKDHLEVGPYEHTKQFYESPRLCINNICRKCLISIDSNEKIIICPSLNCGQPYHLKCAYEISKEYSENQLEQFLVPIYVQCLECNSINKWVESIILGSKIHFRLLDNH